MRLSPLFQPLYDVGRRGFDFCRRLFDTNRRIVLPTPKYASRRFLRRKNVFYGKIDKNGNRFINTPLWRDFEKNDQLHEIWIPSEHGAGGLGLISSAVLFYKHFVTIYWSVLSFDIVSNRVAAPVRSPEITVGNLIFFFVSIRFNKRFTAQILHTTTRTRGLGQVEESTSKAEYNILIDDIALSGV